MQGGLDFMSSFMPTCHPYPQISGSTNSRSRHCKLGTREEVGIVEEEVWQMVEEKDIVCTKTVVGRRK